MKAVYVLVPVQIVIEEDRALLISQPTLDDVNIAYEELGGYDHKELALHDLHHSPLPNGSWAKRIIG